MTEKPPHVQVAEALGWGQMEPSNPMDMSKPHRGYPPHLPVIGHKDRVPHYDTDWSATGPLIERYTIHLDPHGPDRADQGWAWQAYQFDNESVWGDTPLLAVCNLILALSKAGKL